MKTKPYDFDEQMQRGNAGADRLDAVFRDRYKQLVLPVDREWERRGIDRVFLTPSGNGWTVEYKTDITGARTHNCFVEMVSVVEHNVLGWAYTSQAEMLAHYLPEPENICYYIPMSHLRDKLEDWIDAYEPKTVHTKRQDGTRYSSRGLAVPQHEFEAIADHVIDV